MPFIFPNVPISPAQQIYINRITQLLPIVWLAAQFTEMLPCTYCRFMLKSVPTELFLRRIRNIDDQVVFSLFLLAVTSHSRLGITECELSFSVD